MECSFISVVHPPPVCFRIHLLLLPPLPLLLLPQQKRKNEELVRLAEERKREAERAKQAAEEKETAELRQQYERERQARLEEVTPPRRVPQAHAAGALLPPTRC